MFIKSINHALVFAFVAGLSTLLPPHEAIAQAYTPPMVVELSRHTFNLERSGRYIQTVEKTTRITNEYGVDNYGRHIFETNTSKETLKIADAYSITPEGKKIPLARDWISKQHPKPEDDKSIDDTQKILVVFPQVSVGSRLYSRARLKHFKPTTPGEFGITYLLSPQGIWENLEVVFTAPKDLKLYTSTKGFEGGVIKTGQAVHCRKRGEALYHKAHVLKGGDVISHLDTPDWRQATGAPASKLNCESKLLRREGQNRSPGAKVCAAPSGRRQRHGC